MIFSNVCISKKKKKKPRSVVFHLCPDASDIFAREKELSGRESNAWEVPKQKRVRDNNASVIRDVIKVFINYTLFTHTHTTSIIIYAKGLSVCYVPMCLMT